MIKIIVIVWIVVGIGVVLFGILKKRKYGHKNHLTISNAIVVVGSALIWPLALILILSFIKREEQVISEVIKSHPKYTREMIIKGGKEWRNT